MKIALTTYEYNKQGGISRYVAELAEHFTKEHEVHIYATRWKDVCNKDIIFHKVPGLPGPRVISSIPFTIQNTLRFKLLGSKYDIIHINGVDSLCQDIITAHSIHRAGMEFKKKIKEVKGYGVLDAFTLWMEKLNYTKWKYKKIICDSVSSKEELIKYYRVPEKYIEVIPLGVNLDEFRPLPDHEKINLRKKHGFCNGDVILIIVATEFYRKGVIELIKALSMVNNRGYKNTKLMIVGKAAAEGSRTGDAYYKELSVKSGISDKVIFTGRIDNLNQFYNMSDIFVFPTKYEAFGIPTLEAMAAGLPVLNSKIGAGELITDGIDGIHLEDPNNIDEIADKLETLIKDENLRKVLGKNARKTALNYSWDETARKTMEVYKKISK